MLDIQGLIHNSDCTKLDVCSNANKGLGYGVSSQCLSRRGLFGMGICTQNLSKVEQISLLNPSVSNYGFQIFASTPENYVLINH